MSPRGDRVQEDWNGGGRLMALVETVRKNLRKSISILDLLEMELRDQTGKQCEEVIELKTDVW
jgi:hypothetical protein